MPQSLTESQLCQQYFAEAVQLCIRRELPEAVAMNTKFYLRPNVDDMGWVASFVSTFAKRLAKSDVVKRTVESIEKKNIELYYMKPSRPIDHLFTFIGYYLPWFNQFILKEKTAVRDVVTVENIKQDIVEHYHLLPMEGNGREMRYYLMSWDGEYYDGSPTEWNDLKAIRDFLDKEGIKAGDLMWASRLWNLFIASENNRKSMRLVSAKDEVNG